jgi:arylsulfatase
MGLAFAIPTLSCQKASDQATVSYAPVSTQAAKPAAQKRPNILLIVADDLGYADLGVFGSEIPTPNIDALAKSGMLLTNFYANMTCSPTRAMLMSGTDSHLAGLGVMNPPDNPAQKGQPGYEAYLNFRVASMANLLKDAGYNTYMTGKWHLGETVETGPRARGFEKSFISIDGAAHLGGLSWDGPGLAPYRDGDELVTVGDDFYTTRFYTERMIDYIEEDRRGNKPFFAYLAYTAPHWPLQAPQASIDKFRGWYDDGYEALYKRRFARMKELGFIASDAEELPPVEGQPAWEELTDEEKRVEARKFEIYAAMVSDLDAYIGRLIDYLKAIGEYDNTFIFFMSDNGPEAMRRDIENKAIADWVATCCDNSYENLGKPDSYIMYGPNWARASSVAFYRAKGTGFEGGIHVPAFAAGPGVGAEGARNDQFVTVMDILPTFLDLAGAEHPGGVYRGRSVLPVKGQSFVETLEDPKKSVHGRDSFVGWELYGHRAIRQGDWKLVWDADKGDDASWELYDLAADPQEQNNLSAEDPERLKAMISLWETYHKENGLRP